MFSSKDEYTSSLESISHKLYEIYGRVSVMKIDIRSMLSNYKVFKVDDRFFQTNFGGEIVNDTKVAVSLQEALSGNLGNMGKTYGELINMQQQQEKNRYAIELSTSTGAKIGLIIFKGDELALDFDENGLLKVYGIIIDMKKNAQYVDKGNFYGRTLNLYADVPTFILGPVTGNIHGIANYSKVLDLANDEEKEEARRNNNKAVEQETKEHDEIYVVFDNENPERYIARQEGNIIDFEYYYGISKRGEDFNRIVKKDIIEKNIKFVPEHGEVSLEAERLAKIQEEYRQPLVNYKYQNRENCAITTFYADRMNVDVLRLDITGTRSTEAFGGLVGFTSSTEYGKVGTVFTVIPDEAFSYDVEINAADFLASLGYSAAKRMVFIQSRFNLDLTKRVKYMQASYKVTKVEDGLYEYVDEDKEWPFRAFLCGPDFKFVDRVEKIG